MENEDKHECVRAVQDGTQLFTLTENLLSKISLQIRGPNCNTSIFVLKQCHCTSNEAHNKRTSKAIQRTTSRTDKKDGLENLSKHGQNGI